MNTSNQKKAFFSTSEKISQPITLASDSSSLIILQKINLLSELANLCRFFITPAVYSELISGPTRDAPADFKRYCQIVAVSAYSQKSQSTKLSSIDAGVVALYQESNYHAVLSDDKRILTYCLRAGIDHYCSLSLPPLLLQLDYIAASRAEVMMKKIKSIGRFSAFVRQTADDMLKQASKKSLPLPARWRG